MDNFPSYRENVEIWMWKNPISEWHFKDFCFKYWREAQADICSHYKISTLFAH